MDKDLIEAHVPISYAPSHHLYHTRSLTLLLLEPAILLSIPVNTASPSLTLFFTFTHTHTLDVYIYVCARTRPRRLIIELPLVCRNGGHPRSRLPTVGPDSPSSAVARAARRPRPICALGFLLRLTLISAPVRASSS